MRNIAVILAGGVGSRMGLDYPKQFANLSGRTVIEYSISAFNSHPDIDEVAVVVHPQWRDKMQLIIDRNDWNKLTRILDGGAERHLSTLSAINAYRDTADCNLLLHDAARPLIDHNTISRVVEALKTSEAVAVAVPSTDTIFKVENGTVADIPPRSTMMCAQTPQAFRLDILAEAYRLAQQDSGFTTTDDCGAVLMYIPQVDIRIVEGTYANIKITTPEDLKRAETLMK